MLEITIHRKTPKEIAQILRDGEYTVTMRVTIEDILENWLVPSEILTYYAWRIASHAFGRCCDLNLDDHNPELFGALRDLLNLQQGLLDKIGDDKELGYNAALAHTGSEELRPDVAEVAEAWGIAWRYLQSHPEIVDYVNDKINDQVLYHLANCVMWATGTRVISNSGVHVDRCLGDYHCLFYEIEALQYEEPPQDLDVEVCKREEVWLIELLANLIEKYTPPVVK